MRQKSHAHSLSHTLTLLLIVTSITGTAWSQDQEEPPRTETREMVQKETPGSSRLGVSIPGLQSFTEVDTGWEILSGGGSRALNTQLSVGSAFLPAGTVKNIIPEELALSGPLNAIRHYPGHWFNALFRGESQEEFVHPVTISAVDVDGMATDLLTYYDCFPVRYVFPKLRVGALEYTETLVLQPARQQQLSYATVQASAPETIPDPVADGGGAQAEDTTPATVSPTPQKALSSSNLLIVSRPGVNSLRRFRLSGSGLSKRGFDGDRRRVNSYSVEVQGVSIPIPIAVEIGDLVVPAVERTSSDAGDEPTAEVSFQPGQVQCGDVTLRFRAAGNPEMESWWSERISNSPGVRRSVTVILMSLNGDWTLRYEFYDCVPIRWVPAGFREGQFQASMTLSVGRMEFAMR